MSLPAGVQTARITFGNGVTPLGSDVSATAKVLAVFPGTERIVWLPTGKAMLPMEESITVTGTGESAIALPVVDQVGWVDERGDPYSNWHYVVEVRYQVGNVSQLIRRTFQVRSGDAAVDIDLIWDETDPIAPIEGDSYPVRSVNGVQADATGNVTLVISGGGDGGTPVDLTKYAKTVNGVPVIVNNDIVLEVGDKNDPDTVLSVNGVKPVNGALTLDMPTPTPVPEGIVFSVNGRTPDEDGAVTVPVGEANETDNVKSVNGQTPVDGAVTVEVGDKNFADTVRGVNDVKPNAEGNVELNVGVKTVNGTSPNAAGDVTVATGGGSTGVPTTRKISTQNGLTGGGDLSADRTIGLTEDAQIALAKALTAVQSKGTAIGEFNFGGCSAGKMQTAGNYSIRQAFMLTNEPKRFRITFENYIGLDDYGSDAPNLSIGNVYLGEESNITGEDYTYAAAPVPIATGGPMPAFGAYVTPWITPSTPLKNKDLMLTYDLNVPQDSWMAYTYGSQGYITGPQSKATELTTATTGTLPWYEMVGAYLQIKVEYEYEKVGTAALFIGDSTADGWEMSTGRRQGWRGQLTGFAQRWARQTGNMAAVNAFGTSTAAKWLTGSSKWSRINPAIVPDAIVISMGGNDLQSGVTMAVMQANIMAMIDKCYSLWPNAQVFMCTIIPPLTGTATAAQMTARETLVTWIHELSTRKIAGVVDMSVLEMASGYADPRYIGVDGLHLNPRGHSRVRVPIK
jgi:lysophospholipase L1-like esterase